MSPEARSCASVWRISSPTLKGRWLGRRPSLRDATTLKRPGDRLHLDALDDVADLDVVVVLEGHAALEAFPDLADLVLEALERLQRALVNHHVVAQQPD